jgi:hypothetical protein
VHPVTQLEIAKSKLGVVDVIVERVEFGFVHAIVLLDLGVQLLQGIEPEALLRVVQRLTVLQVFQLIALRRPHCK